MFNIERKSTQEEEGLREISEPGKLVKNPLVSVNMITYNHAPYIAQAIEGVLMQQTNFPIELIIGEDSSSDDTLTICMQYQKKFPNIIRLITSKNNIGMNKNFVRTQKVCRGQYVAYCEGDDYWIDSDKLQYQVDIMRNNTSCCLAFHSAAELIDNKLTGKVLADHVAGNKVFSTVEMIRGVGGFFCPTASMIIRRKVLEPIPQYLESAPVIDIFIQILCSLDGGALFIGKSMSVYRRGHSGAWASCFSNKTNETAENWIKKWESFVFPLVITLDILSEQVDIKYKKEINRKASKCLFNMAKMYLIFSRYSEFRETLEKSYSKHKFESIQEEVFFYLRFFPLLEKNALKFQEFLRSLAKRFLIYLR